MQHFGRFKAPKSDNLGWLLVTSAGLGLNVRMALPLQRELDLEGSGRSRNGLFSRVLFGHAKWVPPSMSLIDF